MEPSSQCVIESKAEIAFQIFWSKYPNRVSKISAKRAFANALKKSTLDEILTGVENYKANKPASQQWCHAASWLNAERWDDEFAPETTPKTSPAMQLMQDMKHLDRIEARLLKLKGQQPFPKGSKLMIEWVELVAKRRELMAKLQLSA